MSWTEIEALITSERLRLDEEIREVERVKVEQERLEKQRLFDAQVKNTLDHIESLVVQFQLREALQAFTQDVMREGEVVEDLKIDPNTGWIIKTIDANSNQFPVVSFDSKRGIIIDDDNSSGVGVYISQKFIPGQESFSIYYRSSGLVHLEEEDSSLPLEELVSKYGFKEALNRAFNAPYVRSSSHASLMYDSDGKRISQPGIHYLSYNLLPDAKAMVQRKSNPGQRREWAQRRIGEIPPEHIIDRQPGAASIGGSENRRIVTPANIRRWESAVTGRESWLRYLPFTR